MTHIEFHCSDEKATALLKAARLYDEGVELEPVRHGRWICPDFDFSDYWKCSACNEEFYFECDPLNDYAYHYCPNCGAKMGGEAENGQAD